jgi:hypothetical protein
MMDAFGRGFFEAGGDGCLEHQGLAEKDDNGLRHDFTLRVTDAGWGLNGTDAAGLRVTDAERPGGRHYSMRKVVRNRRNEWVFSVMYAGGCYEIHER